MKRQSVFRPAPASRPVLDRIAAMVVETVDKYLNLIFALNHNAAFIRSMVVNISFFIIWLALSFTARPAAEYSKMVDDWLQVVATGNPQNLLIESIQVFFTIFFNLVVIRHLLALYVPFWLMQRVAAIFLADIFEKDETIAHTFIRQAAFAESYNTIHIRQGKVVKDDQESPMIQIGGPGYVVVELDSAVVFERPDGTARVIGPTTKEWHGSALIDGFERIRQGVDLRDVIQKQEITTRSRDGIPVKAKDIQYSYSIYRGHLPVRSQQVPYPYDENAILNLVYSDIKPIKLDEAPARSHDWLEPLPSKIFGQISGEMSSFINKRGLSDFLVTVGKPEDDSLEERKKDSGERIRALNGFSENIPADRLDAHNQAELSKTDLEIEPRSMLTKMIYDNFQARVSQRGTQLNWIGVGIWDTPTQIIPNNHREAWKISRDNFARSDQTELQRIRDAARLGEQIRLIEEIAIRKIYNEYENREFPEQIINNVLKDYLGILKRSVELYRPHIPVDILKAIRKIEHWLFPPSRSVGEED